MPQFFNMCPSRPKRELRRLDVDQPSGTRPQSQPLTTRALYPASYSRSPWYTVIIPSFTCQHYDAQTSAIMSVATSGLTMGTFDPQLKSGQRFVKHSSIIG